MCTICAAFRPFQDGCDYKGVSSHEGSQAGTHFDIWQLADIAQRAPLPVFSNNQIADVLTDGYWEENGAGRRAFNISDGELTVDLSALNSDGKMLARIALEAWTDVTGIAFSETETVALNAVFENGDAGQTTGSAGTMRVNEEVAGNLGYADQDWFGVNLVAGETYTVTLTGYGNNELADPTLRVHDAAGTIRHVNDDAIGLDSQLTFTAAYSGTHYLAADRYGGTGAGDYRLSVSNTAGADITFDDEEAGGYSTSNVSGTRITSSFVNVDKGWTASGGVAIGDEPLQVYIHEIGHALGLGHAGFYNGNGNYASDAHYANDSWQSSVMSYFTQTENTAVQATMARPATTMIADILAIQDLYGSDIETREGDTVYGVNSDAGGYIGRLMRQMFGDDAPDYAVYNGADVSMTLFDTGGTDMLDLSTYGGVQSIDLRPEAISNALGLTGNIVIAPGTYIENARGGSGNDEINGNMMANVLEGGAGNDKLNGFEGMDILWGGDGGDTLTGGFSVDTLYGEAGNDTMMGGTGVDTLYGGDGSDKLYGNSGVDELYGDAGNDNINGGGGADTLHGGDDNDLLIGNDGWDILYGDAGNDRLFGSTGSDTLWGGEGMDEMRGATGEDQLHGGEGMDELWGNQGMDMLWGDGGDDTIFGGSSLDTLYGGDDNDTLWGNEGIDTLFGENGFDVLYGGTGNDSLDGGAGDDMLSGASGFDTLTGGAGDDSLMGGSGGDTFIFGFGDGADRIEDFETGLDRLHITSEAGNGVETAEELLAQYGSEQGEDYVIELADDSSITLEGGIDLSAFADDIIFI